MIGSRWFCPSTVTYTPGDMISTATLTYDTIYPTVVSGGDFNPFERFDRIPTGEKQTWFISIFRKVKVKPVKGKPSWPPYMSVPAGTKSGVVAPTAKEAINRFIHENPEYGGKKYEVKAVPDIQQPNFNR